VGPVSPGGARNATARAKFGMGLHARVSVGIASMATLA